MRKTATLLIAIFALAAMNLFADKVVTVFYGTKASNSSINPCKGETSRICAIIESKDTLDLNPNGCYKIVTVKDSLGNIISRKEYPGKAQSIISPISLPRK